MFHVRHLFYFILLQLIVSTPLFNLHFTDSVSESESNDALQHDCLRFQIFLMKSRIVYFCMSESSSKFDIQKNDLFPNFTFGELSKQNISSQELYLWSTPIDIIERYQFYLNQLTTSNDLSLATEVFYNCTLPRFGPMCQYQFDYHDYNDHSSLFDAVDEFYKNNPHQPTNLTCYKHLECTRAPGLGCLDWSEICDGHINCLNGGVDEEHCWQLEINDCKDNEYRCNNGQCIPWEFFQSIDGPPDCLDGTDERVADLRPPSSIFDYEDQTCTYTFLSSSCFLHRHVLLVEALLSIKEDYVSDDCWSAFICGLGMLDGYCTNSNELEENIRIVEQTCPDILKIPSVPVLFGDIYFVYIKNNLQNLGDKKYWYFYICYNNSVYDDYFDNISKVPFNSTTCYPYNTRMLDNETRLWEQEFFGYQHGILHKYSPFVNYTSEICNRSNMYQCINSSKCISIYRLMDLVNDCPHSDDEHDDRLNNSDLQELFKRKTIKCPGRDKYVLLLRAEDQACYCRYITNQICAAHEKFLVNVPVEKISFHTTCNGFTDLQPETIDGRNETDETECEQWACNNAYTRCDGVWHCINGTDELGCDLLSPLNCSSNDHICVSPHTNQLICLPIERTNNGIIDCLGAIDEPKVCRRKIPSDQLNGFRCMNDSSKPCIDSANICDGNNECTHGDDEQFCKTKELTGYWTDTCRAPQTLNSSDVDQFICKSLEYRETRRDRFFSLEGFSNSNKHLTNNVKSAIQLISPIIRAFNDVNPRCHRGIDLRVWLNNGTTRTCLCPPTYYGDVCQYQNQRLRLSIQFSMSPNSRRTPFAIVVSLIDDDDDRITHSYEQLTNFPVIDCYAKFQVYLIFSTRPKNETKRYSIHIDIYEKISLGYRGSLLLPVTFPFLPVYVLALIAHIPPNNNSATSCSNHQCNHGKCIRYFNNSEKATFCQCNRGWSGRYCTIPHTCLCSSDSLCIGISARNRSVCVCPINRFGPRCLLIDTVCQTSGNLICKNGGQCLSSIDEYTSTNAKFICICPKGYFEARCHPANYKIILSFRKDIVMPQSIIIHFIEVRPWWGPIITSTFETIPINRDSIIIYWTQPFNIVLTVLSKNNYYLTAVDKEYNKSELIVKMVNPSDRCRHITELFNETIVKLPLVRRIKYYHLPCQTYSPHLSCFYDDVNLCLCYDYDRQHLANCFKFDHNMAFDCYGLNDCENGAQCFQQYSFCPEKIICACPPCFYGLRCQFSTSGFALSLDAILGYHIQPHIIITHQPSIVQISIAFAMIFIVVGLINGILSMITFKNKSVREVGCGFYLLGSSMTTVLVMIILGLKFWILILAQMALIENRSFLYFQCRSFDFILRICLDMDQWLNACVAVERAATVMKGAGFSKQKSKQTAKFAIVFLLILTTVTNIHDPIYRRLIDEENDDEKRIWCIVTYPSKVRTYNFIIHIFHFSVPFIFNLFSAFIIITKKSHQQATAQTHRTYKQHLKKQFRQHKHLIIAPIILVILALPRLIIAFASKCMKSANDSWLFLIGYFISFIPPMLTFLIFIVPSKFYKKELRKTISQYRTNIGRRLQLIS